MRNSKNGINKNRVFLTLGLPHMNMKLPEKRKLASKKEEWWKAELMMSWYRSMELTEKFLMLLPEV